MTNAMEILFNEWSSREINLSPEYEDLLEKYGNENYEDYFIITGAVVTEQKLAFRAGFRTAVQLLMGGVQ